MFVAAPIFILGIGVGTGVFGKNGKGEEGTWPGWGEGARRTGRTVGFVPYYDEKSGVMAIVSAAPESSGGGAVSGRVELSRRSESAEELRREFDGWRREGWREVASDGKANPSCRVFYGNGMFRVVVIDETAGGRNVVVYDGAAPTGG